MIGGVRCGDESQTKERFDKTNRRALTEHVGGTCADKRRGGKEKEH